MRPDRDTYLLDVVRMVALRSTCARRQVGAILTDREGRILATGYNGVPRGIVHCADEIRCPGALDESGDNTRCWAVHAEQNAILQCGDLLRAHTIYCSCTPCFACAKMICNTSIKKIICAEAYTDQQGLDLLELCGIEIWVQVEGNLRRIDIGDNPRD